MEIQQIPQLRSPVMIIALGGWSDAGEAASGLISHLLSNLPQPNEDFPGLEGTNQIRELEVIAEIDSDEYYDFQVNRPLIHLNSEKARSLIWPGLQVLALRNPMGERDFVLVRGVEPSMRWRTFAGELLDLAEDLEVELIITAGSMLADTPHTRKLPVSITGAHPKMAEKFGIEVSQYEGPTGVLAVISDISIKREIDAVSIWVAIPHYANPSPSPKATLALLNELEDFLELSLPQGELPALSLGWENSVTEMVKEDSEIEEYIKSLEEIRDSNDIEDDTGEELAKEVERFLRRQPPASE